MFGAVPTMLSTLDCPSKVLGSDRKCGPCRGAEEGQGACRTSAAAGSRVASAQSWRPRAVGVPQAALREGRRQQPTSRNSDPHADSFQSSGERCDCVHFDQLVGIAEGGHTQKSARRIMGGEGVAHHLPGGDQVLSLA